MKIRTLAAALGAALALTACSSANPMASTTSPAAGGTGSAATETVIVGSAIRWLVLRGQRGHDAKARLVRYVSGPLRLEQSVRRERAS